MGEVISGFRCLIFTTVLVFGIAGLAPLASHFSVSSNRKVTKRMPPRQLRPSAIAPALL